MRNGGDSRDLLKRPGEPSTPTGGVDTCRRHRLNRAADHEIRTGGTPKGLASLITKASWQIECATHSSYIRKPVSKILLCFAGPPPSPVFSAKASKLLVLPAWERSPVRVSPIETDLTRQPPIMTGRRQRRSRPLAVIAFRLIECSPLLTIVNRAIFDE
jgi:hypothetical protein